MIIERRISAFCIVAQIGIGSSAIGFFLEFGNIFGVVFHHHGHIGSIKRRSIHLFHLLLLGLLLCADVLRQSPIILRSHALKVLLGFAVVIDHALAELLYVVALSVLRRQFPHRHFGHIALRCLLHEHGIGGVAGFGRSGLAGVICGLRERRDGETVDQNCDLVHRRHL